MRADSLTQALQDEAANSDGGPNASLAYVAKAFGFHDSSEMASLQW